MQVFTANQRQWQAPVLTDAAVEAFRSALASSNVRVVMSHASYLVNLASPTEGVREKSLAAFAEEFRRCSRLGIPLLTFHPGAHLGAGEEQAIGLVADGMLRTLEVDRTSATKLVVELTAGQGTNIGHRLEQVAAILARVAAADRTAVCVDTAHVYAAGYDIRDEAGYQQFFRDFDQAIGLGRLAALHVNDSKVAHGSRVDRHEELGKGALGREFFERLVRDERLLGVPMMLETPDESRYAAEIALLRKLRAAGGGRPRPRR
jgi:deoxyribonuclease-4